MDNMKNTKFIRKLPVPKDIKAQYPLSEEATAKKEIRDKEIEKVFKGESDKLVLVIGPCSADKPEPVLEYIHRLAEVQKEVEDKILIIPRIYTGKPRTTGEGYKGMLHQPDPEKKPDMLEGIIEVRQLHKDAIEQTGLPAQTKCSTLKITDICQTFFHMLRLVQEVSKIRNTDLSPLLSISQSE